MSTNNSNGPLMALVAQGVQNARIKAKNMSYRDAEVKLNRESPLLYKTELPRDSDLVNLKGLIIYRESTDPSIDINSIEIQIGPQTVTRVPYSILKVISYVQEEDDYTMISFKCFPFVDKINILNLQYSLIHLGVHLNSPDNIKNISFICENVLYGDSEDRRRIVRIEEEKEVLAIETIYKKHDKTTTHTFNDTEFGLSKGIIIECPIKIIKSMSLTLNDHKYLSYNKPMIKYSCIPLSDTLLYIPFNKHMDVFSAVHDTFQGGINFHRIERANLVIETDVEIDTIAAHSLTMNLYRAMNGMAGLMWEANFIVRSKVPTIKYEKITNEHRKECRISLDPIEEDAPYSQCDMCHNNYSYENLERYFRGVHNMNRKCPTCRAVWSSSIKYINADEPVVVAAPATAAPQPT